MSKVISDGDKYHQENEIGIVSDGACGAHGKLLIRGGSSGKVLPKKWLLN